MGLLGEEYPKALLPVGDRRVIEHHLELLAGLGVEEVCIVVGYRGDELRRWLGPEAASGIRLSYADQEVALGSAHALGCVRGRVQGPLLVVLGDYYLETDDAEAVWAHTRDEQAAAIAAKRESDRARLARSCEVQVDAVGQVQAIVEKPSEPEGDLKGCGFYAFPPGIFDALARTPRTALRDEYELTVALEIFLRQGYRMFAEEIVKWDTNLTEPVDVLESNLTWLERREESAFVSPEAEASSAAKIERSIVGQEAEIGANAELSEVLVFPGATVPEDQKLTRSLVTPKQVIPCP